METRLTECQQLVSEEEDGGAGGTSLSPALSSSINSAKAVQPTPPQHSTRIAFVSERRAARPHARRAPAPPVTGGPAPPAGAASRQDAKQTQADLLRLLAQFGAPEASRATQHLADIRQQQDDLARLHFKLGSDPDAPAKPTSARDSMSRLVRSLEQLSTAIEQLAQGEQPTFPASPPSFSASPPSYSASPSS